MGNESKNSFDFGILGGLIGSLYNIFASERNRLKMAKSEKERMDYEDSINDENADEAYRKQREFQMDFLTPEAQIKSLAAGYQAVGINKMAMAGSSPGASASSAPQSSVSGGSPVGSMSDVLGPLVEMLKFKADYKLREKQIDAQVDYNKALKGLAEANTQGQNITNENLPELLGTQISVAKDQLNNNIVQRQLWRSGITANQARAALDRSAAWLNAIKSRTETADANTRERFNYLQNQYMYWSVESAKVQGQFARRMALKQLEYTSQQIALMGEQLVGTKVAYLKGFEEWKQAQFVTGKQNVTYWKDFATDILKTAGVTLGSIGGLSKLIAPVRAMPSPLALPNYGAFTPGQTGIPATPPLFWTP